MLRTEMIRPLHVLLEGHARTRGEATAFADDNRAISYGELVRTTARLAGHLAALGVGPGDRVAMVMANAVETAETYLAVPRAGAVAVCLNPDAGPAELEYMLGDCGARLVVTDAAHADLVAGLVAPDVPVVAGRGHGTAVAVVRRADRPRAGRAGARSRRPRRHGVHALHLGHHRPPEGRGAEPAQLPVGGGGLLGADHGPGPGRHRAVRAAAVPLLRAGPVRARGRGHGRGRTDPAAVLLEPRPRAARDRRLHGAARRADDVLLPAAGRGARDGGGPAHRLRVACLGRRDPAGGGQRGVRAGRSARPCSTATGSPRPRRWSR